MAKIVQSTRPFARRFGRATGWPSRPSEAVKVGVFTMPSNLTGKQADLIICDDPEEPTSLAEQAIELLEGAARQFESATPGPPIYFSLTEMLQVANVDDDIVASLLASGETDGNLPPEVKPSDAASAAQRILDDPSDGEGSNSERRGVSAAYLPPSHEFDGIHCEFWIERKKRQCQLKPIAGTLRCKHHPNP